MKTRTSRLLLPKIALLLLAIAAAGCSTENSLMRRGVVTKVPLQIGDAVVTAAMFQRGKPAPTMINVHDNENTSVAAGKAIVQSSGGRLIELEHGGARLVTFNLDGKRHAFDPNRIFSDAGIRKTLERQSVYSDAAHGAIKQFAAQILERFALEREPAIIALHNNGGSFTIRIYQPGGEQADAAATVHVSARHNPHDFFFVTDQRFFDHLKQRDFNVALQDNDRVPDDGSLSVFFAGKKIPYMNIEAAAGHLSEQTEMVRVAREMLDELGLLKQRD